ncbi:hypothetical protein CCYN49044_130070 [Capnocytophaga cynodegmi]|uniref:Uncharacterized protein n=1 Tax=Capnocytophaga cynodegmi TaxID=28189 RepID=A0A0B7HNZ0_9FLAO|nr:hypothetical protein CCYN49044_130070 [Capnocytophaga cynodegmi]CEN41456.1 hypothetical protein CCYN74_70008 [Capnocytophaga cynodegmi]
MLYKEIQKNLNKKQVKFVKLDSMVRKRLSVERRSFKFC